MTLHRRLILAAAAFSLFALPVASQAQTVMKLASATINDGQHEWQKLFVEALKSKPGGDKIKAEIYPASQLGTIPRKDWCSSCAVGRLCEFNQHLAIIILRSSGILSLMQGLQPF